MNHEEQLAFLDRVWGSEQGYVQFQQKRKDFDGKRTGEPTDTKEYLWPDERDRIGRYLMLRTEEDLYFAVPLYNQPTRRTTNVKHLHAVYVDDDGVTGGFRLEPSISVNSSVGHWHHYWVVDKPLDPKRGARVGFEISAAHRHAGEFHDDMNVGHKHCGTDPGGWDLTQILRVPGTLNTKNAADPHRIEVIERHHVYTIEQLEEAYPLTEQHVVFGVSADAVPDDIPSHVQLLSQLSGRADLIDLFTREPTGRGGANGWDERLFAFENELFRMGFDAKEVYALAANAACNKFRRGVRNKDGLTYSPRPNWPLDLWRDVLKAQQTYHSVESSHFAGLYDSSSVIDADGMVNIGDLAADKFTIELMTEEERELVAGRKTFIDKYVQWAASKTDAALVYHVASAFTILSVIFGEFGHAFPKFGKLRLNLWFMVLGTTTRARKSTSRSLMLKIIDALTDDYFAYDEGSDFTSEALLSRLADKPRQSSLIHRDEVQGMFRETGSKNYLSGLNDTLTELYDGKVRKQLRKSQTLGAVAQGGGQIETNFCLFLMGIVSKVTAQLTIEDFQSGFLARFIHVIGEAPERTRESEWLAQADPNEIAVGDPLYITLTGDLLEARTFWQLETSDRNTTAIMFTDAAWNRWNDMAWDLQESIKSHDRAEVLEAAADRMSKSVMKAAALIAMADMRKMVELEDVLVAMSYASVWIHDMVRSAEMVSESFWKKDMNELLDSVLKLGGTAAWEDVYKKLDKKPAEFQTLIEGLILSGRLRLTIDEKTKKRWLEVL